MQVSQELMGVTAADFNGASVNAEVFQSAVAGCFQGISSADVSITSVTDVAQQRLRRRLQASGSAPAVMIDYTITYNLATRGYSGDPDGCFAEMLATLQAAVNGTVFNENLAESAAMYNAADMSGCTSGPVASSGYLAASSDDNDDGLRSSSNGGDTNGLTKKENLIIGMCVGVGGFLLVFCIIGIVLWWRKDGLTYLLGGHVDPSSTFTRV